MKGHNLKKPWLSGLIVVFVLCLIVSDVDAQVDQEDTCYIIEEEIVIPGEEREGVPQYAPGEVLVKFKEGVDPQSALQEINLEPKGIERVHSIKPAVARFKKGLKLEKASDGWYWFRGDKYKEVDQIPDEELFKEAYQKMSPAEKSLYSSYKITLPEGMSVEEAIVLLEALPEVEYAHPNYIMKIF